MSNKPKKKKGPRKGTLAHEDISWLSGISEQLDSIAKATANQIRALEEGRDAQQVFDDQIINHTIRVHEEAIDRCAPYGKQFELCAQPEQLGYRLQVGNRPGRSLRDRGESSSHQGLEDPG